MRARVLFCLLVCAVLVPVPLSAAPWKTLKDCRLQADSHMDEDSFHVVWDDKDIHVRLYFADCPETDKQYGRYREQVEQFGVDNENTILRYGKKAKELTEKLLAKPFTVKTTLHEAPSKQGTQRYYAFVTTADGDDLGLTLIKNGLAQSKGVDPDHPDVSTKNLRHKYDKAERDARRARLGIFANSETATPPPVSVDPKKEEEKKTENIANPW